MGQLKPKFHVEYGKKVYSNAVLRYCQPPGAGSFSRDFTINVSPQCRAFSRALKT